MAESKLTIITFPWDLGGDGINETGNTIFQNAGRTTDLAFLTVMARQVSDQKLVPLTDVDSAMTPASLACSAIGGTPQEFAALSDAEFGITVDGEALELADMDMTGLDTALDTPGYMTCGAIGGTLAEFAAVADGQFGIAFDGNTAIQVGSLDFSGIDTVEDTPGYWNCGTNGDTIANWDGLTDAAFSYVIDGAAGDTGVMNLTTCVTFADVVQKINFHLNGIGTMTYGWNLNEFKLISNHTGEVSSVTIGAPASGTDISVAAWLNQAGGSATAGTGGENLGQTITSIINAALQGRGTCYFNGDAFVFISRTAGEISAVADLTAGSAGTDISGAGFLNGLAATNVAGTGGEGTFQSIVDIINAHALGRFICEYSGDNFVFYSPTRGPVQSQITVLSDPSAGGTDISGPGFLNGLTGGAGTVTAATGANGTDQPAGLLMSDDIASALIVAGDVTNQPILIRGAHAGKFIDEDFVILENSLTLDSVIVSTGKTIRQALQDKNIFTQPTDNNQQIQPL